jgi:predicted DNA-binding protein (MmcQ/YjbR family)
VVTPKAAKARLMKYALAKPDTTLEHPWGENVAKVHGKVFVFFGPEPSEGLMGVKLTKALLYAKSLPYVEAMGYGLGKSGWVGVNTPKGAIPVGMLEEWIDESYANVAPKRATARSQQATKGSPRGSRPAAARATGRTSRSGDGRRGTRSSSR